MDTRTLFWCSDETLGVVIETLARGRNVRTSRNEYRCGWKIIDERCRDENDICEFSFIGNINELIILQMIPGVEI